jgi:DNA invertase Pin-like site-specific DNA recombinase
MLIGYARVSSNDQETVAQVAALKAAKCERVYREKASGGRWDRPELQRLSVARSTRRVSSRLDPEANAN